MKKFLTLLLTLTLCFSFVACGADESTDDHADEPQQKVEQEEPADNATMGEKNALAKAEEYLSTMAFSKSGLAEQLEYEKFEASEIEYAIENCGANWKEQAALKAQEYLDSMSFSKQDLIDQLKYEGFTTKQAEYGVDKVYN